MHGKIVVIGAGAAGMTAAVECLRRGFRALVVDKNLSPGRKIAASGGGRCNMSNAAASPGRPTTGRRPVS